MFCVRSLRAQPQGDGRPGDLPGEGPHGLLPGGLQEG